jgi:IS30 family transposase
LLRTMRAMTTWFCDAYASWQKGGVENANGRLRRSLPRQIDIDQVSDEEIQDIVITANLTPRKCLGFKIALLHLVLESRISRRCRVEQQRDPIDVRRNLLEQLQPLAA